MTKIAVYKIMFGLLLTASFSACSRYPDITSETIRKISTDNYAYIDWSPDGSTIIAKRVPRGESFTSDLFLVDLSNGSREKVTDISDRYDEPKWSPNGDKIAITVDYNTIWIMDVASWRSTYLTTGEGTTWFSDGDKLAIYVGELSNDGTDHREVRIVDLQGNTLRTLDAGAVIPELLQLQPYEVEPAEGLMGIDMSSDDESLLISLFMYEGRIEWQGNFEPREEAYFVNLRDERVDTFLPGESVGHISWAPDGKKIAYIRPRVQGIGKLVIADAQGHCLYIPDLPAEISSPSWGPDSSELAFLYGHMIHIMTTDPQTLSLGEGCP